jgi:two-component system phosphate regulon response regulator PhoB
MENKGRVLTRAKIIAEIWSRDTEADARKVDVHLGRLRRAIDRSWEPNPIRTVHSVGYIFDSEQCANVEVRPQGQHHDNLTA